MTAPIVLFRPSTPSGETVLVPRIAPPAGGYRLTWEHGPEGSGLYSGASIGNPESVTATALQDAEHRRLVAGYQKLAAQSVGDDEKAIDAGRRDRRDRIRALRSI